MNELNELTRRLLAEGYAPEDTPPGTRKYEDYEGGWTYESQTLWDMVFETPCGLLVRGRDFANGYMSWNGVDWRPKNDNPVLPCPRFPAEPCPLRHPLLQSQRLCGQSDKIIYQCNCRRTDRPYTFEGSVDELRERARQEAEARWESFRAAHKGRVCRNQSRYGRTSRTWTAWYSPLDCAQVHQGCTYCAVLDRELSPKKGNVFYDLKRTWTVKGVGLFPDEQVLPLSLEYSIAAVLSMRSAALSIVSAGASPRTGTVTVVGSLLKESSVAAIRTSSVSPCRSSTSWLCP